MKTLLCSLSLILSCLAFSATQNDVTLPDTMKVEGADLVLNGIATRKATFLKVKVYVGGLYLEKKSSDFNELVNFKGPKHLTMHFVRDVEKKKLVEGWNEAFANAHKGNASALASLKTKIDQFNSIQPDMKEGEVMSYTFTDKGVQAEIKGQKMALIEGADFAKSLLSVWFVNPADEQLSSGLLGK
jgi:hypothetical protein